METGTRDIYDMLIWGGALISVIGLLILVWCIIRVTRARRAKLSDEDLRAVVRSVVPVNLGAMMLSVLGLMLVVIGIFFS